MNKNIGYFIAALLSIGVIIAVVNMQQSDNMSFFKSQFMEGCTESNYSGAQKAFCSCAYDSLYSHYGKQGFIEVVKDYNKTGKFSEESINLVLTCVYEQ